LVFQPLTVEEKVVAQTSKRWRAIVSYGPTGSWQQNGFDTKEAAEKAAENKAGVISRKRKRKDDVGWRAERE
jgi:hypothetical protein